MKLTAHAFKVTISEPTAAITRDDSLVMGVGPNDHIRISLNGSVVSSVIITDGLVKKGEIYLPALIMEKCGAYEGDVVDVEYCPLPESIRSIRKKIHGGKLSKEEIGSVINDIMDGVLSEREILAFVSAFNVHNADLTEVAYLTRAMAATGKTVDLGVRPVFDFHSLGGVPGNKVTPIVVSIVASQGLPIPKLSSRAISSACGTSDFVDTFCDVEMDSESLKNAVRTAGGVFACGNEDYAPVGNIIIKAERPMGIDPRPVMIASIMSKKIALGTTHLLMDLPMGEGAKIPDMKAAEDFAGDMISLGTILGVHVECAVSDAGQPIGRAIGPILEARECIEVLEGRGDPSVAAKACAMAGIILEMAGEKDGESKAREILSSGMALKKFREIVKAQNGDPNIEPSDLIPGKFVKEVHARFNGFVQYLDNRSIVAVAKAAGAPSDTGAGIMLDHKAGDLVKKGDVLFRIFAENQSKLDRAIESARSRRPMKVDPEPVSVPERGPITARFPSKEMLDLIRFRS